MDFIDKKEKLADLIEEYISEDEKEEELTSYLEEIKSDDDFKDKELFQNIIGELENHLHELSRKELKQRVLLIRSFIE